MLTIKDLTVFADNKEILKDFNLNINDGEIHCIMGPNGVGKSTISVCDFANLQLGDIIKIDRKVEDELEVYVGDIRKFKALPGSFNDNYAVRITEVIREE